MIVYPKTREEAMRTRYQVWVGNPKGHPYDPYACAAKVWGIGTRFLPYQCCRKPGHGPDGLYCKQHARMVERLDRAKEE